MKIKKSPTADTRTCDWSNVTEDELFNSSSMHIRDVKRGLNYFKYLIDNAAAKHDHDKLSDIAGFHADFKTGFKSQSWYENHKKVNRHHLQDDDGIPSDVDLVDVLEYITDCVMAGKARSGSVTELNIKPEVLMKAFKNTAKLLASKVEVEN